MWRPLVVTALLVVLSVGCKETIIEHQIPEEYTNDLLHADLIGKVVQKGSGATVVVSQVSVVDSAVISPQDGSFEFRDLRAGNYDVVIRAANYRSYLRTNVLLEGGGITYLGEIDLSTVPDLVDRFYPENNAEIVYDWRYGRITISVIFTHPMDRESVERAFSTSPPSEGVFTWGTYTQAPQSDYFWDEARNGFDPGATITTFSRVTSFTYSMSAKDSYVDTSYTFTLSTVAKDTLGNHLQFPLVASFRTVQSYTTIYGIQSNPVHGDIDIRPINSSGIEITFPRRMDPLSTESAVTITPAMNKMFLWPSGNQLRIYTGGPYLSDTTITVRIDSIARDKDGILLGKSYAMWFRTAPFRVEYSTPNNAQLFVSLSQQIILSFNSYVILSSVAPSFEISPAISGSFSFGGTYPYENPNQIVFTPSGTYIPNTKYTVRVTTGVRDMYGIPMKETHIFSFVTRPN